MIKEYRILQKSFVSFYCSRYTHQAAKSDGAVFSVRPELVPGRTKNKSLGFFKYAAQN